MLDIDVPPAILDRATLTSPGASCDQWCADTLGSFDGSELVADLLGIPAATPGQMVAGWTPIAPAEAIGRRGCAVINRSGRMGITMGRGVVVEPMGRIYAITTDPAGRWVAGYLLPGVTYTVTP